MLHKVSKLILIIHYLINIIFISIGTSSIISLVLVLVLVFYCTFFHWTTPYDFMFSWFLWNPNTWIYFIVHRIHGLWFWMYIWHSEVLKPRRFEVPTFLLFSKVNPLWHQKCKHTTGQGNWSRQSFRLWNNKIRGR